MRNITPEVANRIRRAAPHNGYVVQGSLPVVSFGDMGRARVATLSLNPSDREFLRQDGSWLLGDQKRLESLVSLGAEHPSNLTEEQVTQVVQRCEQYFDGPWFGQWFSHLERLLKVTGVGSYLDGSACHLDLVQWATRPKAGDIPRPDWDAMVEEDKEFLSWQLRTGMVNAVLINGASSLAGVEATGIAGSFDTEEIGFQRSNGPGKLRVSRATKNGVVYLGWNLVLHQGISTDGIFKLAEWISARLAEQNLGSSEVPI